MNRFNALLSSPPIPVREMLGEKEALATPIWALAATMVSSAQDRESFQRAYKRGVAIDLGLVRRSNRGFRGIQLVSGTASARPVCASRFRVGCRARGAGSRPSRR